MVTCAGRASGKYTDQKTRASPSSPARPPAAHGAITSASAAHVDLPVVQGQVGHAGIVLTADTYTSVAPGASRDDQAPTRSAATGGTVHARLGSVSWIGP
ncbi:hypothetical protein Acor_65230 [Acrocarpospora corrugata]|uniref:Tyr recombinase domain-containing protein n=1 Tax=Acrocarpospora corrugata TaxID=35763 RepID=A0A5M3W609_9ACTN|nr:hypothetical protein Acor_65230 [Acrocarpospora corrugata]